MPIVNTRRAEWLCLYHSVPPVPLAALPPAAVRAGTGFVWRVRSSDGWQRQGQRPWRWSFLPTHGKLALFVQGRPAANLYPIRNPQSPIRNRKIGFVLHDCLASQPASPGKLGLFCQSPVHVEFTITLCPERTCPSHRSGANWVCFARFALRAAAGNWVRFAHFVLRGLTNRLKLGSFCMICSSQLGSFVQPARAEPERPAAGEVPPQSCPESAIEKLALFCRCPCLSNSP
jgi:hypothetical protein